MKMELTPELDKLTSNVVQTSKMNSRELIGYYMQEPRFADYGNKLAERDKNELARIKERVNELRPSLTEYLNGMNLDITKEQADRYVDDQLFRIMISESLTPVVEQVKKEYGNVIPPEKMALYEKLTDSNNIIIDRQNAGDIRANSETGEVILNPDGKEPLENRIMNALGASVHESFHILVTMLKSEEKANEVSERMFYKISTSDGEKEVHFRTGKYGQLISEGFVEKMATEFAERNNFFYRFNPSYVSYVDLVNELEKNNPEITPGFLFTHDADAVYDMMSPELREKVEEAERLAVINNFHVAESEKDVSLKNINSDNVVESWLERNDVVVSKTRNKSFVPSVEVITLDNEQAHKKSEEIINEPKEAYVPTMNKIDMNRKNREDAFNNFTRLNVKAKEDYEERRLTAEEHKKVNEYHKVKKLEPPKNTGGFTNVLILCLLVGFIIGTLITSVYFFLR